MIQIAEILPWTKLTCNCACGPSFLNGIVQRSSFYQHIKGEKSKCHAKSKRGENTAGCKGGHAKEKLEKERCGVPAWGRAACRRAASQCPSLPAGEASLSSVMWLQGLPKPRLLSQLLQEPRHGCQQLHCCYSLPPFLTSSGASDQLAVASGLRGAVVRLVGRWGWHRC
jgi:hypothetical protein